MTKEASTGVRYEFTENSTGTGMGHFVYVGNMLVWSHVVHIDGPLEPAVESLLRALWGDRVASSSARTERE